MRTFSTLEGASHEGGSQCHLHQEHAPQIQNPKFAINSIYVATRLTFSVGSESSSSSGTESVRKLRMKVFDQRGPNRSYGVYYLLSCQPKRGCQLSSEGSSSGSSGNSCLLRFAFRTAKRLQRAHMCGPGRCPCWRTHGIFKYIPDTSSWSEKFSTQKSQGRPHIPCRLYTAWRSFSRIRCAWSRS